ncbi:MAG: alpha-L-fucosidase [Ruminococcaceae bacterium]|nr:alpha-L-fucosidase [Oscillospiraceae bacterium]
MIIKDYIKSFEKLGFGMFVHFGTYSVLGKGEWSKFMHRIPDKEYEELAKDFCPNENWAKDLVKSAKKAGCKYITLTTRHHDGFSLYDTCGLNDYDAPHFCGRDLVREFVDACNENAIIPFFYHTLLDWREESYNTDFPKYLEYLRASVELLCKNYGKIGGFWFDGMWNKWDANWEEDALYSLIRSYQGDTMIINNTGLNRRGQIGHIELDSVTFERGRPSPINQEGAPKYLASEMCQTFGSHWGYAKNDLHYKSLATLIEDLCVCRKYGSNFLLNVGPRADGSLRVLDRATLETLGEWVELFDEAIRAPRPSGISVDGGEKDFILKGEDGAYYLFVHSVSIKGDPNVADRITPCAPRSFTLDNKVKKVFWLDNMEDLEFSQESSMVSVLPSRYDYGSDLVVRVAKIITEKCL